MDAIALNHAPIPSQRGQVEPFHAMEIMAKANALRAGGRDVAMLCVGQPAAPAPKAAREAAARLIADGPIGYTDALGRADLRHAIAAMYGRRHGHAVDPARIVVTTGSSAGFSLAFLAAFEPGARVAIACPGYPAYRNILRALSLRPVELRTTAEERHALTPRLVEEAHARAPLAGLLVASPANPTGTMMDEAALRDLADTCERLGVTLISDEIYHGLSFPGAPREVSLTAFAPSAIVINSFSKYYCMTGWRVGWMVVPPSLVRTIESLAQNLYISAPEVSQVAALHALEAVAELDAVRDAYLSNRALLVEGLPSLGFTDIFPADGAFYIYASTKRLAEDSAALAHRLLELGVAATPGRDFDPEQGHEWMRFSYAGDEATMRTALQRMARLDGPAAR